MDNSINDCHEKGEVGSNTIPKHHVTFIKTIICLYNTEIKTIDKSIVLLF